MLGCISKLGMKTDDVACGTTLGTNTLQLSEEAACATWTVGDSESTRQNWCLHLHYLWHGTGGTLDHHVTQW